MKKILITFLMVSVFSVKSMENKPTKDKNDIQSTLDKCYKALKTHLDTNTSELKEVQKQAEQIMAASLKEEEKASQSFGVQSQPVFDINAMAELFLNMAQPIADGTQKWMKKIGEVSENDLQFKKNLISVLGEYKEIWQNQLNVQKELVALQWLNTLKNVEQDTHGNLPMCLTQEFKKRFNGKELSVSEFKAFIMNNLGDNNSKKVQ
jgi:hypothetical protein